MIFWKANATQHNDVFHIHICLPNVFVCGYYSTSKQVYSPLQVNFIEQKILT